MLDMQGNEEVRRGSELFDAPDEPATGGSCGRMPKTVEGKKLRPSVFGTHTFIPFKGGAGTAPNQVVICILGGKIESCIQGIFA